ncbi:MAG: type II secretion system protein [Planctomycetota bacterium]
MMKPSKNSLKRCKSTGLTLIEVIVSVTLIATLLVSFLAIHRQHIRQIKLADKKSKAISLADQLLGSWFANDLPLPNDANGLFDDSEYSWSCQSTPLVTPNQNWRAQRLIFQVNHVSESRPLLVLELMSDQLILPTVQE